VLYQPEDSALSRIESAQDATRVHNDEAKGVRADARYKKLERVLHHFLPL
jgi:hypothetical protein